ncbi:hypothetical protein CL648_00275 [bacterium]|nr:hypothetical protein [bacterium]
MNIPVLFEFSTMFVAGLFAQWVSWRMRLPAILPLLLIGLLVGPVLGILHPDRLMGDLLFPFVSLSVAIILFEGGLSLKIKDIHGLGNVVWNLNTIGVLVNWVIIAISAYLFLDMTGSLSTILGAILVVTGPTVIGPLLKHVRLDTDLGSTLRWESIIIDPVGAVIAVLAFEWVFLSEVGAMVSYSVVFLLMTLLVGVGLGLLGGGFIMMLLKRGWAPAYLHSSLTLATVMAVFVVSNFIQLESGLLSVTVMGLILANQNQVKIQHILRFKEDVTLLLISVLFVMLAARISFYDLVGYTSWNTLFFLIGVVFVARPLGVFLCTIGSRLTWRHKVFMSLTAPRGIIAASIGSLFALKLSQYGIADAEQLVFFTFIVIFFTVAQSGLFAGYLAKWLGVTRPHFYGVLIAGSNALSRSIATQLINQKIDVLLVDTNQQSINEARVHGIPCIEASILDDSILDELEDRKIGRFLAVTSNDDLNVLAVRKYRSVFGRNKVYRLFPQDVTHQQHLEITTLFSAGMTYTQLVNYMISGYSVVAIHLNTGEQLNDILEQYDAPVIPLFFVSKNYELYIFSEGNSPPRLPDMTLIALVP